jgi:hypothetical protein
VTSWQDIQAEIVKGKGPGKEGGDFDSVRRAKYSLVKQLTGRPLLIYATAFHAPHKAQFRPIAAFLTIDISDKDGFQEIIDNVSSDEVDIFLHSPGGSAEATESIVKLLRSKFKKIRFVVTGSAKSAATMLALSGDSILMNRSAELGPIDPQVSVRGRFSPAGSIKEQFNRAADDLARDPSRLPVWIPILEHFAPCLLVDCDNFIKLAKTLVINWMTTYMFQNKKGARDKARKIAKYLSNEKKTLSHARRIDAEQLKRLGVTIELLEDQDSKIQDAFRQLHLSIMATLDSTGAVKIFENSEGAVLIRMVSISPAPPNRTL